MRLTRDLLIGSARTTAEELQIRHDDLVCVYLTGSVQEEEPLIGGTTDIDLICVHSIHAPTAREILPLGENCHLDIAHYTQSQYGKSKTLRLNPWLGSFLCYKPLVLFDSQHWFEYTQAGVSAQFLQPGVVGQRVEPFIKEARQIWLELSQNQAEPDVDNLWRYLKSLELAGNALACLVGVPITERRFIADLPVRCEALERPGLAAGLVDLYQPTDEMEYPWEPWIQEWRACLLAANTKKNFPVRVHSLRIPYYEKAILANMADNKAQALWMLLRTWTIAAGQFAKRSPETESWRKCMQAIQLGKEHFSSRLQALDVYLEAVEETISNWRMQNGAE